MLSNIKNRDKYDAIILGAENKIVSSDRFNEVMINIQEANLDIKRHDVVMIQIL